MVGRLPRRAMAAQKAVNDAAVNAELSVAILLDVAHFYAVASERHGRTARLVRALKRAARDYERSSRAERAAEKALREALRGHERGGR